MTTFEMRIFVTDHEKIVKEASSTILTIQDFEAFQPKVQPKQWCLHTQESESLVTVTDHDELIPLLSEARTKQRKEEEKVAM